MTALQLELQRKLEAFLHKSSKPLVVILGATASGKTGFSINLALHLEQQNQKAEVINADSRQLYKYLNIGTAKITEIEKRGVPHHLIDILDPKEEAAAGWYQTKAFQIIDDIHQGGNIPLLVGGSMLYLSTVIDNLTLAPDGDTKLRQQIMAEYKADNGVSLFKELSKKDPMAASKLHQNNMPRLVRAIEICRLTNFTKTGTTPKTELRSGAFNSPYDLFIIGIQRDRAELYKRINKRAEQMIENGWIDEVQELLIKGYSREDPGIKSHGYREVIDFIEQKNYSSIEELVEEIAKKSRHYARRQLSWWRNDKRIEWINTTYNN